MNASGKTIGKTKEIVTFKVRLEIPRKEETLIGKEEQGALGEAVTICVFIQVVFT